MRKLIAIVFVLFLMVGNVSALSEVQIATINATLTVINQKVGIILDAREDVRALLRLDPHVNNDTLILAQIAAAKARAAQAASDLDDLLQ